MKGTLNKWLPALLLSTVALVGNACAVEMTRPSLEERVKGAELIVVADNIEQLPHAGKQFNKFFRVKARVASVLKGQAKIGDHIEVVVDNTIAELRNDCCSQGQVYVFFLRAKDGKYQFVGSPSGSVLVELQARKASQRPESDLRKP